MQRGAARSHCGLRPLQRVDSADTEFSEGSFCIHVAGPNGSPVFVVVEGGASQARCRVAKRRKTGGDRTGRGAGGESCCGAGVSGCRASPAAEMVWLGGV